MLLQWVVLYFWRVDMKRNKWSNTLVHKTFSENNASMQDLLSLLCHGAGSPRHILGGMTLEVHVCCKSNYSLIVTGTLASRCFTDVDSRLCCIGLLLLFSYSQHPWQLHYQHVHNFLLFIRLDRQKIPVTKREPVNIPVLILLAFS